MRLIYFAVLLFISYGEKVVRALPLLDLDTYNPEEFNLVIDHKTRFNLEIFTPKTGEEITEVADSGTSLYSSIDTGVTVSKVEVYSVHSVPQLVHILLNDSGVTHSFQKKGNQYHKLNNSQFDNLVKELANGGLEPSLEFALNIQSQFSTRQLFTKKDDVLDGVNTFVFIANSSAKLTLINDGNSLVTSATGDEHFTKVSVSQSKGNMVLMAIEGLKNGQSNPLYFYKSNGWRSINQNDYVHYLGQLRPVDIKGTVTLDVTQPSESEFHVVKDFESGLTESTYSPNPGFELTKVTHGETELWSSNENRAAKVVVYSVGSAVELVQVEVKNVVNDSTLVNLYKKDNEFAPISQQEFSQRVQLFKQYLRKLRENANEPSESNPSTLDVLSPDPESFSVTLRVHKGVHYKEFVPKANQNVNKIVSSGNVIWTANNVTVQLVNVFLKNQVPTVYQVVGFEHGGKSFSVYLRWDQTVAEQLTRETFDEFLKSAARAPNFFTSLDLNINDLESENLTLYTSKIYGVNNLVVQPKEGLYFRNVSVGDNLLWSTKKHPGVTLNQATIFKTNFMNKETYVLMELGGFHNGNFVSYYFTSTHGLNWRETNEALFKRQFALLKFPDYAAKRVPVRRHSESQLPSDELPSAPEESSEENPESPSEPQESPEEGQENEEEEVQEPEIVELDTENVNDSEVSVIASSDQGYYFKSYSPKGNRYFGSVRGPEGFHYNGNGERLVTLAKFFWAHAKLVGASLFTVSKHNQTPLIYYYTYQNNEWNSSLNIKDLTQLLNNELTYTKQQKIDLENLRLANLKYMDIQRKLKEKQEKELEKQRKQEERENEPVMPDKLSKKTKMYDEMNDFSQYPPPKQEEVEETEEEIKKRTHKYGKDEIIVESELLYYELSDPSKNNFVHSKNYTCMGLPSVDVTPFAGKYLHVVSSNGKRVWVSSNNRRATNMQLFYVDNQIVGALLTLTSIVRGNLISGEEFDYLFVKDGELQRVNIADFMDLANTRFQSAALVSLSKSNATS